MLGVESGGHASDRGGKPLKGKNNGTRPVDRDRVGWKSKGNMLTSVDEYRLSGWGRDLSFCDCDVGVVRARVVFSKNDLPAGELTSK
jgi:hypothetical protein